MELSRPRGVYIFGCIHLVLVCMVWHYRIVFECSFSQTSLRETCESTTM